MLAEQVLLVLGPVGATALAISIRIDQRDPLRHELADHERQESEHDHDTADRYWLGYVRARALVDRLIEQTPLDLRSLIREPLRVNPELKTLVLMLTTTASSACS